MINIYAILHQMLKNKTGGISEEICKKTNRFCKDPLPWIEEAHLVYSSIY